MGCAEAYSAFVLLHARYLGLRRVWEGAGLAMHSKDIVFPVKSMNLCEVFTSGGFSADLRESTFSVALSAAFEERVADPAGSLLDVGQASWRFGALAESLLMRSAFLPNPYNPQPLPIPRPISGFATPPM